MIREKNGDVGETPSFSFFFCGMYS